MTLDKSLLSFLKSHKKTYNDIEFISSTIDKKKYQITKEDFLEYSKDVEEFDINSGLEFVGNNFYVHTDGDEGFFTFVGLPKKPKRVINVAKEILVGEKARPAIILGIEYESSLDN